MSFSLQVSLSLRSGTGGCASPGSRGHFRGWRRAGQGAALAGALVVALAGCSAGAEPPPAPDPQAGLGAVTTYSGLPVEHVLQDVSYAQTPPVGGRHWPPQTEDGYGWQRCDVYTEPVVDEFAVHSLEHGAVWLTYQPGGSAGDVAALADLATINPDYVLVSPVATQPQPFMATAWGLQLGATSPTDPTLRAFTARYAAGGQGGEKGADCANGSTVAQAQAALSRVTGNS